MIPLPLLLAWLVVVNVATAAAYAYVRHLLHPLRDIRAGAVRFGQGDFTQTLVGSRVQVNISTALQFSTYWQYDTESRDLGTNTRLRWSFSPLGDVFLVYNHNASDPETGAMQFKSNDLRLKVQYTFRY